MPTIIVAILIIGGTGNTGLKLARLLRDANVPVVITSRSGTAPESFPARDLNIDKVYPVGPTVVDQLPIVKSFIDMAIRKGVRDWGLASASQSTKGGVWLGTTHQYLHDSGANYTALRPSSFSENFSIQFLESVMKRNEIISAAEDARILFIATQDIAQAAFEALTTDDYEYAEPHIVGPELLTYDEVTAIVLSEVLGRKISHRRSIEEMTTFWLNLGLPEDYAAVLANAETGFINGSEEKAFFAKGGKNVKYIGKTTLRE
ncbi:hypothetical protein BDQ17DRAFT_1421791 [Cyathus striatus]|nr:hypothetical protein BDQ17DRAFT_1421791 [Cyathus striatus]